MRKRLYLGLFPLLLIVFGTGAYAILVCLQLSKPLQEDLVGHYRAMLASQAMRSSATEMSHAITMAREGDPIGSRKALDRSRADFNRNLMDQSHRSAGTPRAVSIAQIDASFQRFSAQCDRAVSQGGLGSLQALAASESALYSVIHSIDDLTQADDIDSIKAAAMAARLARSAVGVLIGLIFLATALSVLLAWQLAASLLTPITALTTSAEALGDGNLDIEVPETSRDELGRLAHAFNTMAAKLRAYRDSTIAKVLRTQRTMEATLASTPDPLFVVSADGSHEVRNPAAEELIQLPEFAAGFPPGIAEPLERVLATGEHYLPTDYRHVVSLRMVPDERHYLPRILAIGDKLTEFKGAAVIFQDVTRLRLLDDVKTNLVGTVSHELKTPLTSLRMAVYLLLERTLGPLTGGQLEMLESARDDADRLLRILDSLLDLSRLEAGASALDRRDVPVAEILNSIAEEARGFIQAAHQTLQFHGDSQLTTVSVDPDRIRHVFINLLSNASKYSGPNSLIFMSATQAPGGFVRFSVHDEGMGIPQDSLPRLFDRFYRVPGRSKPGAGIGLAIAREIVVAHGGSIACSSEPGKGTEFHFLVPTADRGVDRQAPAI